MSSDASNTAASAKATPAPPSLPNVGDVVAGKYKIEKLLGRGGMGAVFRAHHEILHQPVAIKMVLPEIAGHDQITKRFLNEARAAARIQNEHVARVLDTGHLDNGTAFMVLEFLDGKDLSEVVETSDIALPIDRVVDWTLEALEAIAQAHALGIVHRDLKPANLFLARRQDGTHTIKVLDFGISKATNPAEAADGSVTTTQALLGSPAFMSPEQIRSSKNVDARADVWSLGIILYKLISKKEPYNGESVGALFASIFEDTPARLTEIRSDVPAALDEAVFKCLQRDRDKRFQNVAHLAHALAPYGTFGAKQSAERIARTLGLTPSMMPAPPAASSPPGASTTSASPMAMSSTNETTNPDAPRKAGGTMLLDSRPGTSGAHAKAATGPGATDGAWAESNPGIQPPAKKSPLVAIAAVAGVAVVATALALVFTRAAKDKPDTTTGSGLVATTTASASPTASATASPIASSEVVPTATTTAEPSAVASTTASAPAATTAVTPAVKPAAVTAKPAASPAAKPSAKPADKPKAPDDSVLGGSRN